MKHALILALCLLSVGCIRTKTVGKFPVTGFVLDARTEKPLEGAEVYLEYLAVSNFGNHSKNSESVYTDSQGRFLVPPQKIRLWGGWGPLTGYIKEWPAVYYRKEGYKADGKMYMHPCLERYQNMRLLMEPDNP